MRIESDTSPVELLLRTFSGVMLWRSSFKAVGNVKVVANVQDAKSVLRIQRTKEQ